MTLFCLEKLHRLPEEVDVPLSALVRAMIAADILNEKEKNRYAEMERKWQR